MQEQVAKFKSDCGKAIIYVENTMPLGSFHDFLMLIKSLMVERMLNSHQEQAKQAKESMSDPTHESELPINE